MVATSVQITRTSPKVIRSRLQNGSWVTSTEVPDDRYNLRYDVTLDGAYLGKLVLLIAPLSGEHLWMTSANDEDWSPPVHRERDAMLFLIPQQPAC